MLARDTINREYTDFLARARHTHGDKFDPSGLAPQFVPYFHNGQRIEVNFMFNGEVVETKRGTVSATAGWRPSFMLMLRRTSMSSSHLLDANDVIVKVIR